MLRSSIQLHIVISDQIDKTEMRALVLQLAILITTQTRVTLALSSLLTPPYKHFNLEMLCGSVNNKQSLYLHNQAHQFTFNATNKELIKCHLELHLHSDIFGFSVFIQEMKLEDSKDCSKDFLQFGRCESIYIQIFGRTLIMYLF